MRRPSRSHTLPHPEQLEQRLLLTVKVNFNERNGLLKITGDNADNIIEVDGLSQGDDLELFVDHNFVDGFANVRKMKINLKGGDDDLHFSSLRFSGNITMKLGEGADLLDIDSVVNLGSGADQLTDINGIFKADFGENPGDIAEFDGGARLSGSFSLTGVADVDMDGKGTSFSLEPDDDIIFSELRIQLSGFGDVDSDGFEIELDNVFGNGGFAEILGSNFTDRINLARNSFLGLLSVELRDGDDVLKMNNGVPLKNRFDEAKLFDGGDGNDSLLRGSDNTFFVEPLVEGFETVV